MQLNLIRSSLLLQIQVFFQSELMGREVIKNEISDYVAWEDWKVEHVP